MQFQKMTVADEPLIKSFLCHTGERACDTSFVNLLVWQEAYGNLYAVDGRHLFIKTSGANGDVFRLPLGDDLEAGIDMICDYAQTNRPIFWAQEGERLDEFRAHFSDRYTFVETRDAFDYLYLQRDLATLAGKKYQAKRNHISSFSKKYDWHYEPITSANEQKILACAEKWYAENADRADRFLQVEQKGLSLMLSDREGLCLKGGAIVVGDEVVAYTLGSPINHEVFDIHMEKALADYATAYSVINREFAKNELGDYLYINREDDMGLEGLRRAKLSYHPAILLKKYYCRPR